MTEPRAQEETTGHHMAAGKPGVGAHYAQVADAAPGSCAESGAARGDGAVPASRPSHLAAPSPSADEEPDAGVPTSAQVAEDGAAAQGAPTHVPEQPNPYVDPTLAPDPVSQAHDAVATAPQSPGRPETASREAIAPGSTGPIPIDLARQQAPFDQSRAAIDLDSRANAEFESGSDERLSWAARTDVGLVRGHNEDSYLVRSPLFGICDGMGGHAAGEVASAIAVRTIAEQAPEHADDPLLGAAVEAANEAVIQGAVTGVGKPGMGCTATVCLVEGSRMAVAHVGDSRIYLLHAGTLVRVTHDHSYVEELVDAGEITADEARTHPSRSIITRALGSDPDMYADHFTLDVERGDRIIVCSDGLSSMVPDSTIEALAVSSATAHEAVDALVGAALAEGGHDNVTVIVVDVTSDGSEEARRRARVRAIVGWAAGLVAMLCVVAAALMLIVGHSWYVGTYAGKVGIYQGVHGSFMGMALSHLEQDSDISLEDLPQATQHQLAAGITVSSEDEARATLEAYRQQIQNDRSKKEAAATGAQAESADGNVGSAEGEAGPESAATGGAPATDAAQAQQAAGTATTEGGN